MNIAIQNTVTNYFSTNLNEKYGISEFDNEKYRNKIADIIKQLKKPTVEQIIISEFSDEIQFNILKIHDLNLTWLKELNIYYTFQYNKFKGDFNGDTMAAYPYYEFKKYIKIINDKTIEFGSIFMAIDLSLSDEQLFNKYISILYHEIAHLYDLTKKNTLYLNNDIVYSIDNEYNLNDINDKLLTSDITEIYKLIKICIYYANITESHAWMENINFDIQDSVFYNYIKVINKIKKKDEIVNISTFFKYSSNIILTIFNAYKLLLKLKNIDNEIITEYNETYGQELFSVYEHIHSFQMLYKWVTKKLKHIINNSQKLFNYYLQFNQNLLKIIHKYEQMKTLSLKEYI